ncbi:TorD/DmsD family molecular chaperone [Arcanobacterium bovis]|uniref:TorD/DmsD family molecular chaperone n=1 Tax=Arcanobacterium bovis TaxID=2529275 RepID=UPI0013F17A3F|nr:molecular chaperone TorD family protein [Arcanobacterium bovis]
MNTTQLEAVAAAFSTLARLHLHAPDGDTLAELQTIYPEWPLQESYTGITTAPETARGLQLWAASFNAHEDAEAIADDLNLLYGRTATAKIAPYESVHRGQDRLIFDEQTLEVRNFYRELNLEAPHLNREPDDHIGLEFDFIAQAATLWLTALEHNAPHDAERYRNAVVTFHKEHLSQWAPEFLENAEKLADTKFLQGMLALSQGALRMADSGLMDSGFTNIS